VETGFLARSYHDDQGVEQRYTVFVPAAYDPEQTWPAIFFMHGAGERGTDNQSQLTVGLGPVVKSQEGLFPAITFFPQMRTDWSKNHHDLARALAELDQVQREFNIDEDRIYVTGLSMGGHGTWAAVQRCPGRFAAAVAVCGFFDHNVEPFTSLPCWFFHGTDDSVVPVRHSRKAVAAIRSAGGNPKYTEFPGVDHDSWIQSYDTPELYDWLFAQRR